jgi:hypothetical protein
MSVRFDLRHDRREREVPGLGNARGLQVGRLSRGLLK